MTLDALEEKHFWITRLHEAPEKALDGPLQQSAKLVVDLRAGTYQVYCPVADHEERGMTRPLVVQ